MARKPRLPCTNCRERLHEAGRQKVIDIDKDVQWTQKELPEIVARAKAERAARDEGGVWAETDEDEKRIRKERGL